MGHAEAFADPGQAQALVRRPLGAKELIIDGGGQCWSKSL
jgi:hypothetical protein